MCLGIEVSGPSNIPQSMPIPMNLPQFQQNRPHSSSQPINIKNDSPPQKKRKREKNSPALTSPINTSINNDSALYSPSTFDSVFQSFFYTKPFCIFFFNVH